MEVTISRDELDFQLVPFKYQDAIIFATKIDNFTGLWGIKRNALFFIDFTFLEESFDIELPSSIEENNTLYITIIWTFHRWLMTPNAKVQMPDGMDIKKKTISKQLFKIIKHYEKELDILEKKYG